MVDEEGFKGGGWAGEGCAPLFVGFSLDPGIQSHKSWGFEGRWVWVRIQLLPLTGCVPLSKSLPLSELFVSSYVKWHSYGSDLIGSHENFLDRAVKGT